MSSELNREAAVDAVRDALAHFEALDLIHRSQGLEVNHGHSLRRRLERALPILEQAMADQLENYAERARPEGDVAR